MNYKSIYHRNQQIYRENKYTTSTGKIVDFDNNAQTTLYREVQIVAEVQRETPFCIADATVRCGTIDCILKLRESGIDGNITALNFANALMPGGAYVLGGNAQEESLCRASLLYHEISKCTEMYRHNLLLTSPLYSDYMIYSRDVLIIADDDGQLLEQPCRASFITSPAVNRTCAKYVVSQQKIDSVMERRINKIVSLAVCEDSEVIVLGAFGCGAFGNQRERVFPLLEQAVNRYVPNQIKVVFAEP